MGKTFRKIGGNGNFKSMIFNESQHALELFKQPPTSEWMIEPNFNQQHFNSQLPM